VTERAGLGVAFLGGGSGGHIYPSLAVAEALERLTPRARAVFITGDRPADEHALRGQLALGEAPRRVPLGARPLSRRPRAMLACARAWGQAVRESRKTLGDLKKSCEAVVAMSTGGYVSAPAAQAAWVERVPLVLVSLDARIGKANRFIARRATRRLVAQSSGPEGWQPVGPIVGLRAIATDDKAECRRMLGLDPFTQTLLVMGGSQGATSINAFMSIVSGQDPAMLNSWQVLHLAGGEADATEARASYTRAGIRCRVFERLSPVGAAWGAADFALTRSGAGTVAEAHANGVPAIFLPYPHHRDQHQAVNAQVLVDAGGALVVTDRIAPESNFESIGPTLRELLESRERREAMARALRALPRLDGASACARLLLESAKPC
jgi:UDP-N-acetylglucosamine--N-acetylmuramyl-(pentapeptide) pyrophosphoryl-undecaprenol N-acetylglucosamine transferase